MAELNMIDDAAISDKNAQLRAKYDITAMFYDILDYPWGRMYEKWRPSLLADVRGSVLEAGVGMGRNLNTITQR